MKLFRTERESEIIGLIGECLDKEEPATFEWIDHCLRFVLDCHWKCILAVILSKNIHFVPLYRCKQSPIRNYVLWTLYDIFRHIGLWKLSMYYVHSARREMTRSEWDGSVEFQWDWRMIKYNVRKMECAYCAKKGVVNNGCSGCGTVNYCSRRCQKKDWKRGHRLQCRFTRSVGNGVPNETWKSWYSTFRRIRRNVVLDEEGSFLPEISRIVKDIARWSVLKREAAMFVASI